MVKRKKKQWNCVKRCTECWDIMLGKYYSHKFIDDLHLAKTAAHFSANY